MSSNLNGWAISTEALDIIMHLLPKGSTILELGSGTGTKELVKRYKVYSIEQNSKWLGYCPEATYIHAPLKTYNSNGKTFNWFDADKVIPNLPEKYDFLLIDAPIGGDRGSFIYFRHLFKTNVPYLIDDTQRKIDLELAIKLSELTGKSMEEFKGREKNFSILY
jgi:hypothetical protein